MGNKAQYDDGQEISCEPGYCGISPDVPVGMEEYLYSSEDNYSLQDEINGTCEWPAGLPTEQQMLEELVANLPETGAEQSCSAARDSKTLLKRTLEIEFIHFGKKDRFPFEAFEVLAPKWRDALLRERGVLEMSLRTELECYQDWLAIRNSLWGSLSRFSAWVKEIWQDDIEAVKPEEYQALLNRADAVGKNFLFNPSKIQYLDLHEAGLEMMRIREAQKQVSRRSSEYREQIIQGAESSLAVAKATEWAAFKFNDTAAKLAAKISQPGNPLAEATYRLMAVVVPKVLGRSVGEWSAAIQGEKGVWWKEGTGRKMFKQTAGVLVSDGASILSDLIVGKFDAALDKGSKLDPRDKETSKAIIRIVLEVNFTIWDAAIFDKKPADVLEDIAWRTAKRACADAFKIALPGKQEKGLGAGIANVIEILFDDFRGCQQKAKKTNQELADVIWEQLFITIVKCVAGFAIGYFGQEGGPLDKWAKKQFVASEISKGVSSADLSSRPLKNEGQAQIAPGPATKPPPPTAVVKDPPVAKPTAKEIKQAPLVVTSAPTREQKRQQSDYWRAKEKQREVSLKAKARNK